MNLRAETFAEKGRNFLNWIERSRNRADLSAIFQIDENVRSLVSFLRFDFPLVRTISSCGGHTRPNVIQKPWGEWFIGFKVSARRFSLFELFDTLIEKIRTENKLDVTIEVITDGYVVFTKIQPNIRLSRHTFFLSGKDVSPQTILGILKEIVYSDSNFLSLIEDAFMRSKLLD